LQNAGLTEQGRGVIAITDGPGLKLAACGCYGIMRERFEQILRLPPQPR
jgi:hypothetical protein